MQSKMGKMGKIKKPKGSKYPKLMISVDYGNVYLVTSKGCGTCVFISGVSSDWTVGDRTCDLYHDALEDFNGTIKLSN